MKKSGHVVLEKADVCGVEAMMAVCGDLGMPSGEAFGAPVTGELKGKLATWFSHIFLNGIKKYGEDYLQAAVMAGTMSPAAESPVIGPGCEFGTGCAGMLACGHCAYVWAGEGSGMCVLRSADVLGKKKMVRALSSETGGEDILEITDDVVLLICPEDMSDDIIHGSSMLTGVCDISDDASFDRYLGRMAEGEKAGCIAALLVKER